MTALSREEADRWIADIQGRSLAVGLFTSVSTEVTGGGYARVPVALTNGVYTSGVGVRTDNTGDVYFGVAQADWAAAPLRITYVKVFDTSSGDVVWAAPLSEANCMSVIAGQPYEIKVGTLGITLRTYI